LGGEKRRWKKNTPLMEGKKKIQCLMWGKTSDLSHDPRDVGDYPVWRNRAETRGGSSNIDRKNGKKRERKGERGGFRGLD